MHKGAFRFPRDWQRSSRAWHSLDLGVHNWLGRVHKAIVLETSHCNLLLNLLSLEFDLWSGYYCRSAIEHFGDLAARGYSLVDSHERVYVPVHSFFQHKRRAWWELSNIVAIPGSSRCFLWPAAPQGSDI
jgi:hypothetical protein